jgi:hypothetical protein
MLSDFLLTIISSAAVSAALSGLLLWITKTWIGERLKNAIKAEYDTKLESHKAQLKAEFDKQVETHKSQLKAAADVEVERLKSTLSIAAAERNTTFVQLHTRRVDVIADTYARLKKLHDCVANYVKSFEPVGERSKEERRKDVTSAAQEFTPYFSQNQIFLPKAVSAAIEQVNQELVSISNTFIYAVELPRTPDVQQWGRITDKFNGSVKEAVAGLEDELRRLLGDKS